MKRPERSRRRDSQAVFVDGEGRGGGEEVVGGLLGGEVGGDVFLLGADLLLGFDFEEGIEGASVASVGGEPEGVERAVGSSVRGSGTVDKAEVRWSPWVLSRAGVPRRTWTSAVRVWDWLEVVMAPNWADMERLVASATA